MKRIGTAVFMFLILSMSKAWGAEWAGTLGFSKLLDLRIGAECFLTGRAGIKIDAGYSFLSETPEALFFTYDLAGMYRFTKREKRFILKGLFGIMDGAFMTFSPPIVAFSPGISIFTGLRIGSRLDFGIRAGLCVLINYQNETLRADFPWPDLVFELHYHFPSPRNGTREKG